MFRVINAVKPDPLPPFGGPVDQTDEPSNVIPIEPPPLQEGDPGAEPPPAELEQLHPLAATTEALYEQILRSCERDRVAAASLGSGIQSVIVAMGHLQTALTSLEHACQPYKQN